MSLVAWQNARKVKLFCYDEIVPKLPAAEKYNLKDQIIRAATSSTANIAEGYGRFHYKESAQFYRISRGSLYELKDHLISCNDLNYIDDHLLREGLNLIEDAKINLNGYIKFVLSKVEKF
ncbi:MAG: four helix bundle protein [Candidatus Marinimicrobia bacterium]|nr:four helix bundle protein [Candidatus Neomarinimicrobiota bacterium]